MRCRRAGGPPADPFAPSQHLARKDRWRRLFIAMLRLPPTQRDAVLRFLPGASIEEVAAALGRTRPAVSCLLQRAGGTLRHSMDDPAPMRAPFQFIRHMSESQGRSLAKRPRSTKG